MCQYYFPNLSIVFVRYARDPHMASLMAQHQENQTKYGPMIHKSDCQMQSIVSPMALPAWVVKKIVQPIAFMEHMAICPSQFVAFSMILAMLWQLA